MISISVIIPVYNGALTIRELTERLAQVLPALTDRYELIFVEDNGTDNSWDVILELVREYPWVRGIRLMRNFGQHNALLCGIRVAKHNIIVTMDDDLQHPPEELPVVVGKLEGSIDVVYGTPREQKHGFWRNLASRLTKRVLETTMGYSNARKVSAFRVFRTDLRDGFINCNSPFVSLDVLLSWTTTRFAAVTLRHDERQHGKSNYTFFRLVLQAINMLTGYTTLPLRFASLVGFACTLFGIVVLAYVAIRYLVVGYSVPGFPFLASTVAIFSGVQLFALGILGEYLSRMYYRMLDRPIYLVRSDTQQESEGDA